jgi:hypothetical protein
MKSDERDEFDSLLDAALANYANVEPPPGMDERIVARLRASDRRAGFGWWRWAAVAIPVLACLVAVFAYRDRPPLEPPRVAWTVPPAPVLARPVAKRVRLARPAPLPRREVFPTPTPLTSEERALLALVAQSPELARELLTPTEPKPIEPIKIEPISDGG